jgi:hypothetical protein
VVVIAAALTAACSGAEPSPGNDAGPNPTTGAGFTLHVAPSPAIDPSPFSDENWACQGPSLASCWPAGSGGWSPAAQQARTSTPSSTVATTRTTVPAPATTAGTTTTTVPPAVPVAPISPTTTIAPTVNTRPPRTIKKQH